MSSYYPLPADAPDIFSHAKHYELWLAVRERYRAATGALMWPYCGEVWDSGHVTAQTETTITIGGKAWDTSPKRWVSYSYPGDPDDGSRLSFAPANYDLVIFPDTPGAMPWQVIHRHITDQPAGDTVTLDEGLSNYVTTKQISAAGDVAGWAAVICKRGQIDWAERWPQWHNPHEAAWGVADGPATDETHIQDLGLLSRLGRRWRPGELVGKEVIFRTAGGEQRRCLIDANAADTFAFNNPSGGTIDSAGPYTVVTAGEGPARADRPHFSPAGVWYWGYTRKVWTLHPDVTALPPSFATRPFGPVDLPFDHVDGWQEPTGVGGACELGSKYALDQDVWVAFNDPCNTPRDACLSPYLFRTFRGLQAALLGLCTTHVEDATHEGSLSIHPGVPATMLYNAGVHAFAGTAGSLIAPTLGASTQIQVTGVTLPAGVTTPVPVHFAVRNPRGCVLNSHAPGPAGVYNNPIGGSHPDAGKFQMGTLSGAGPTYTLTFNDASSAPQLFTTNHEGQPAIFSLGFTWPDPLAFRWMYDRTIFIPDNDAGGPVVPPTEDFPGHYETRAKSTAYVGYDELGDLYEDAPFEAGKVATYLGDNWHDTYTRFGHAAWDGSPSSMPAGMQYLANFTERAPGASDRPAYLASLSGTATEAGTTTSLRDDTKSWATSVKTHSGTATGGSTTTLEDTSKAGSPFFDGSGGRWLNHMIRVRDGGGSGEWHRRPVTAYNGAVPRFTFPALPFTVTAGTEWEIDDYEIPNRWSGRPVRITRPGAWAHDATATHSDDTSIVWTPAAPGPIQPGDRLDVLEELPGTQWQWDGTRHVQPTGTYHAGPDARPARPEKNTNHPNVRARYGLAMKGMLYGGNASNVRNEIAACLATMKGFTTTHQFTRDPTDTTPAVDDNPNDWAGAASCSYASMSTGSGSCDPTNPVNTCGAVESADYFWNLDAGEEVDSYPLAVGMAAASRTLVGSAYVTGGYRASYHHRHAWGKFDLGYDPGGAITGYDYAYYVWTIIPGLIPVAGGFVDPPGDAPLHPAPFVAGGDAGEDLYGFGPGTDNSDPNRRNFDANGYDVLWRQMHAWASGTVTGGSGSTSLDSTNITADPLGTNGKIKPNLPSAPTPPDGTTSTDYKGCEVREATVLISPHYLYCT